MKNELKETVRAITPKFLLFYIAGSVVLSIVLGFYSFVQWASGFGAALTAINLSSSMFTLGAPFVMGASLLLPSFFSSKDKVSETREIHNARFLTISRFLVLFILSTAFVISWILLSYYLAMQEYTQLSPDLILAYLPGTIISGLIMTIILSALTTTVATIMDDWKLALIANLGLFFMLGTSFGSTFSLHTSDTLAIFGPYHLYRFLSLFLSGNISDPIFGTVWGNPTLMNMILGINFGFADILISFTLWIVLSIALLIITQHPMKQNISRLRIEIALNRFTPDDQNLLTQMKEIKQALNHRRLLLGALLVIMLFVLPLFQQSVTITNVEESQTTLYQSPSNGVMLSLGSWAYGEVEVPLPSEGLNNMYQIRVEILDWGGCPDELERLAIFSEISMGDFEGLNETEKDDLVRIRSLRITPDRTVVGSGFSAIQSTGTHLWAFKFVPAEGYSLQGTMHIRISVVLKTD
ncbi:MAG: hypothetical protein ACW99U_15030 [Candidatus Thorarchaeota archaeon]